MKTFVPDNDPTSRVKVMAGCLVGLFIPIAVYLGLKYVRVELPAPTVVTLTPAAPPKVVTPTQPIVPTQQGPAEKTEPAAPPIAPLPKKIDLLEKVDVELGTVSGKWSIKDGELVSDNSPGARLQIPVEGPDEYDVICEFTRLSGNSTFNLLLSRRGKKFGYCLGFREASSCHFFDIHRPGPNPTAKFLPLQNGKRYDLRVEVRDKGLKAYLDGAQMAEWATNYSDMGRWDGWDLKNNNYIGVGTWESPAVIHKLDMIEIKKAESTAKPTEF